MVGLFGCSRHNAPGRRPPGRCPNCRRMTLEPELPGPEQSGRSPGKTFACVRCGQHFQREFAGGWCAIRRYAEIDWVDERSAQVQSAPGRQKTRRRRFPALSGRFKIRQVMLVTIWVALNLAFIRLAQTPHEFSTLISTMIIIHLLALRFIQLTRMLSRHPIAGDPPPTPR